MRIGGLLLFLGCGAEAVSLESANYFSDVAEKGQRMLDHFLDFLYPLPPTPADGVTAQDHFVNEATSDPKLSYLLWQGAMEIAGKSGKSAVPEPENLIPETMALLERAQKKESSGAPEAAKKLREEAAEKLLSVVKVFGYVAGHDFDETEMKKQMEKSSSELKTFPIDILQQSAKTMEIMAANLKEPTKLQQIRKQRELIQNQYELLNAMQEKIAESDMNIGKEDHANFRSMMKEITKNVAKIFKRNKT